MKTKISILFLAFGLLCSFQLKTKADTFKIKKGMLKMAIYYPNEEGKTFDMDYYANKHMPMAASLFGDDLKAMAIDKALADATGDIPKPYVAVGYFYFDNMASFQKAMAPHRDKIKDDVSNYTNIRPVIQLSEVVRAE